MWDKNRIAQECGIEEQHLEVFFQLVGLLRTPQAQNEELEALREELGRIDALLREEGIEYPTGANGIRNLINLLHLAQEDHKEAYAELARVDRFLAQQGWGGWKGSGGVREMALALATSRMEYQRDLGTWGEKERRLREDARNYREWAQAAFEGIDQVLVEADVAAKGLDGVQELASTIRAMREDHARESAVWGSEAQRELDKVNAALANAGYGNILGSWGVQALANELADTRQKYIQEAGDWVRQAEVWREERRQLAEMRKKLFAETAEEFLKYETEEDDQ